MTKIAGSGVIGQRRGSGSGSITKCHGSATLLFSYGTTLSRPLFYCPFSLNMSLPTRRRGAVTLLHAFCEQTKVDYYEYVPQLIRSLILLFVDTDEGVLQEAWNALNAVTKTLDTSKPLFLTFLRVPDPDLNPDPHVFGPPGSGFTCQRYGSGSFYHQAKIVRKKLNPTVL